MDGQITQVVLTLSGIVLLIVTLGFVAKRANKSGLMGAGAMRIVSSLNLGVKEKLVLIEVGSEQLLVATGAAGITKLHVLSSPVSDKQPEEIDVGQPENTHIGAGSYKKSFQHQLDALIKQK